MCLKRRQAGQALVKTATLHSCLQVVPECVPSRASQTASRGSCESGQCATSAASTQRMTRSRAAAAARNTALPGTSCAGGAATPAAVQMPFPTPAGRGGGGYGPLPVLQCLPRQGLGLPAADHIRSFDDHRTMKTLMVSCPTLWAMLTLAWDAAECRVPASVSPIPSTTIAEHRPPGQSTNS